MAGIGLWPLYQVGFDTNHHIRLSSHLLQSPDTVVVNLVELFLSCFIVFVFICLLSWTRVSWVWLIQLIMSTDWSSKRQGLGCLGPWTSPSKSVSCRALPFSLVTGLMIAEAFLAPSYRESSEGYSLIQVRTTDGLIWTREEMVSYPLWGFSWAPMPSGPPPLCYYHSLSEPLCSSYNVEQSYIYIFNSCTSLLWPGFLTHLCSQYCA